MLHIVDDDVEFAESLKDFLETKEYDGSVVYSGSEALEKVKKEKFAIVHGKSTIVTRKVQNINL